MHKFYVGQKVKILSKTIGCCINDTDLKIGGSYFFSAIDKRIIYINGSFFLPNDLIPYLPERSSIQECAYPQVIWSAP